jgi:hypothetical protein
MDSDKKEEPIKDENLTQDLLEWKRWAEKWLVDVDNNKKDNE